MTYFAQIGSAKLGWFQSDSVESLDEIRTWAHDILARYPECAGSELHIYRNGPEASDYAHRQLVALA